MGFIFLLMYVPLYLVAMALSFYWSPKRWLSGKHPYRTFVAGAVCACLATFAAVRVLYSAAHGSYSGILLGAGASLFFPVVLGLTLRFVFSGISGRPSLKYKGLAFTRGVFSVVILMPALSWITVGYYKDVANYLPFRRICETADIQVFKNVSPVKSVHFEDPSWRVKYSRDGRYGYNPAIRLIKHTDLERLTEPAKGYGSDKPEAPYVEYSYGLDSNGSYGLRAEPRSELAAEYSVSVKLWVPEDLREYRIYGRTIAVNHVPTGDIIAKATYFADWDTGRVCPDALAYDDDVTRFLAKALNLTYRADTGR